MATQEPRTVLHWKRPPSTDPRKRLIGLTEMQALNARRALRHLRDQYGRGRDLAAVLGVSLVTVAHGCGSYSIRMELVVRMARLTGVAVEEILDGAWPEPRVCPLCGHKRAV